MLKKVNRLAKSKDIQKAFARGRTFFNPLFTLKAVPSAEEKRFTVVVSTKVYKNAVDRNRLKRLIREHIRLNLKHFRLGNYVVVAKPSVAKNKEKTVMDSIALILSNIVL
ncbi:MAG: ribonuclease P protein component [Candidatus Shapirobacteria bacterium]|nr:ribonuclease P protein component [Candidatus Shapirobacteria bacterium]